MQGRMGWSWGVLLCVCVPFHWTLQASSSKGQPGDGGGGGAAQEFLGWSWGVPPPCGVCPPPCVCSLSVLLTVAHGVGSVPVLGCNRTC